MLDLACGHGRHSVELARHGCAVTGVDLSEPSLALAAARAAEAGVEVRLERADMRRIAFDAEFDAVINMFTAFGYFVDDAENRLVMVASPPLWRPAGRSCSRSIIRSRCSDASRPAAGTSSRMGS